MLRMRGGFVFACAASPASASAVSVWYSYMRYGMLAVISSCHSVRLASRSPSTTTMIPRSIRRCRDVACVSSGSALVTTAPAGKSARASGSGKRRVT